MRRVADALITCARDESLLHAAATSACCPDIKALFVHVLSLFMLSFFNNFFFVYARFSYLFPSFYNFLHLFIYCLLVSSFVLKLFFFILFVFTCVVWFTICFDCLFSSHYILLVLCYNIPRFLYSSLLLPLFFSFPLLNCQVSFIMSLYFTCFFKFRLPRLFASFVFV